MKCPVCLTPDLVMTDRQGIEIDYCPQCRGVWLDRGELDKIIDRSAAAPGAAPQAGGYAPQPGAGYAPDPGYPSHQPKRYDDDYKHGGYGHGYGHHHKKKRGGFLGEIFDFD
ncbi:MAG TPA: zf-TFIIB domain-containing protein [Longimicrobium sp.]|nr:zf-TFIIB domain-containing protein [Longimicrobium sp.]